MRFNLTHLVVALSSLVTLPSVAQALRCKPACSCVTGVTELSTSLREEARLVHTGESSDSTMAFDVTLERVTSVDTLVEIFGRGLRRSTVRVERFVVHRAWGLQHGQRLNRTLENVVLPIYLCPRPDWRLGRRYLVFAEVFNGRITIIEPCDGRTYARHERTTRAAIDALNERWARR